MADWARVVNTTIRKHFKGEEPEVLRNRKVFAMMRKRGRFMYNCGGADADGDGNFDWSPRYRRVPMTTNNGEQTLTFPRQNRWKKAVLPYVGYALTDSVTKKEKLLNSTNQRIIDFFGRKGELLMEDLEDAFTEELYVDSSASGNSDRVAGLESLFAVNGTLKIDDGTQRSANAADVVGYPNDTYATLSTALGNYGGAWGTQSDVNSAWPFGKGGSHGEVFDFWSPVVVNYTSTEFSGSSPTFALQGDEALRFAIDAINTRNKGKNGQVDLVILDRGLYRQLKELLKTKERINVTSQLELRSLGFKDVIEFDGVEVTTEYGIPAGVGYVLNLANISFLSMQDQIFVPEGPEYDIASRSWRLAADVLGQYKFSSPRMFAKLATLA